MPSLILIVDDDPACLSFYDSLLRSRGYSTLTATSGRSGLSLARQHRPQLILLDLSLPDQNGFVVMKALRADPRLASTRVLFITGVPDPAGLIGTAYATFGACGFLRKPSSASRILSAVKKALHPAASHPRLIASSNSAPHRLRVDPNTREVWMDGRVLPPLGPRRFELLCELAKSPQGISRESLLAALWGDARDIATVDRTVERLRRDLGDATRTIIVNVPGGYKLVG